MSYRITEIPKVAYGLIGDICGCVGLCVVNTLPAHQQLFNAAICYIHKTDCLEQHLAPATIKAPNDFLFYFFFFFTFSYCTSKQLGGLG